MGTINFVWWNLQNFFDTDDDPLSKDFHYTVADGWTGDVFAGKKANLAAALAALHDGAGPDLLAVAEIEKDGLLAELVEATGNRHLRVVHDRSGTRDLRGIDVAMAYDHRKLRVRHRRSHLVHLRYRTRDLFEVTFEVKATGERFVVVAGHWPSRRLGRYRSEPLRCAVAEHAAFLVEAHVKVEPEVYEELRDRNDLATLQARWETKVMVVGDFNDEPCDRSVVDHLRASNDLDRVVGPTNDLDRFAAETADYRAQEVFLYNPCWKFLPQTNTGSYFLAALRATGEKLTNRYQVLDQLVVTRGLLHGQGLTLDCERVALCRDSLVATRSGRPRAFNRRTRTGTSDHLPLTAVFTY